ncbi:MAG: isoamylase early set domain-containing protein [Ilumatobacteraceae bacterium]
MITTSLLPNGDVLVTFMIDDERPVSVVGDFNGWDPHRDPFVEELDGRRYVTVSVPADTVTCFRYLADTGQADGGLNGGEFFDDPAADRHEPNGYGQTHSVLDHSLRSDVQRDDPDRSMSNRRSVPVSA